MGHPIREKKRVTGIYYTQTEVGGDHTLFTKLRGKIKRIFL